ARVCKPATPPTHTDQLISAIYQGDFAEVERLTNTTYTQQPVDPDGLTPLMAAASLGRLKTLIFLLSKKADIHARDALGNTALSHATAGGMVSVMSSLLDSGSRVNTANNQGCTALHIASHIGSVRCLNILLKKGARINLTSINSLTTLHEAVHSGKTHATLLLLRAGADANTPTAHLYAPLHFATAIGSADTCALLLIAGADPFALDSTDDTPIKIAAIQQDLLCNTFTEFRPSLDLSFKDANGDTLLHFSAREENENFEWLVHNGADITAANAVGETPLHSGVCEGRRLHRNELIDNRSEMLHVVCLAACLSREFLVADRADLRSLTVLELSDLRVYADPETG
ncbi:ankyrin repeat-containing domain protein, partial [Baffinella frigidus]